MSSRGQRPLLRALWPGDRAWPAWLSGSAIRFAVLCAFIAAVAMLSPHVTPRQAGLLALGGALATIVGGLALVWTTRHLAEQERAGRPSGPTGEVLLRLLRATGLPLLGLAFFLIWSFVYLGTYWYAPASAFRGLGHPPRYADFFYYSVSTALISPPGDIIAQSRGARAATIIEMLAGLALVTTYLSGLAIGRLGRLREASERAASEDPPAP